MADVTPLRRTPQVEEFAYKEAVSEAVLIKMAQSVAFINAYQHSEKQFFLNGKYNSVSAPQYAVDGLVVFEYDAEILNAYMFHHIGGSDGTTTLDIKRATSPGGAFSSIFSTTPKITSSASDYVWIGVGDSVSGCTAPVLSVTEVSAGDALRVDLLAAQTGDVENCGIIIHYRPR